MKLDVAVVCLDNSHADAVKRCLVNKQGTQERINLHVKCADSLEGEMYDVIIMSALSKDHEKFVEDRHIMSAITKARLVRRIVVKIDLAINFTIASNF